MGIGTAIVLFAIGAILTFAVEVDSTSGLNVNNIGIILMLVGIVGGVLSMLFWNSWGGFGNDRRRSVTYVEDDRPDVIVEERPRVRRTVIREEER